MTNLYSCKADDDQHLELSRDEPVQVAWGSELV